MQIRMAFLCLALVVVNASPVLSDESELLAKIYKEDQALRHGKSTENSLTNSDSERRRIVFKLIAEGKVTTPESKFKAARILHHTDNVNCGSPFTKTEKIYSCSKGAENFLLAHFLAKSAFAGGYADALYLVPRTMDRYLFFSKGMQKYGTVATRDKKTGEFVLPYIDRRTTDEERASLGLGNLKSILKKYRELPRPE